MQLAIQWVLINQPIELNNVRCTIKIVYTKLVLILVALCTIKNNNTNTSTSGVVSSLSVSPSIEVFDCYKKGKWFIKTDFNVDTTSESTQKGVVIFT